MAGLVLKLAPGEKFFVNGSTLENGDRPTSIRVADNDTRVLRMRDALHPNDVRTPVSQVYYAIQLLITGDLDEADTLPALRRECDKLDRVFGPLDASLISRLRSMIDRGNYYSALCHLRQVLLIENELLRRQAPVGVEEPRKSA